MGSNNNSPVVRIAIPAYSGLTSHTKKSVDKLLLHGIDGYDLKLVIKSENCNIGDARCRLVNDGNSNKKLQSDFNFDYIFFVDDDIEFQPEQFFGILNLAKKHGIASGFYPVLSGCEESLWLAGNWGLYNGKEVIGCTHSDKRLKSYHNGIYSADWIGLGFCCVKSEVFRKIEFPWFYNILVELGENIYQCTEDIIFCDKVNKAGYKIYVDTSIRLKHFKESRVIKYKERISQMEQQKLDLNAICFEAQNIVSDTIMKLRNQILILNKENVDLKKQIEELKDTKKPVKK